MVYRDIETFLAQPLGEDMEREHGQADDLLVRIVEELLGYSCGAAEEDSLLIQRFISRYSTMKKWYA